MRESPVAASNRSLLLLFIVLALGGALAWWLNQDTLPGESASVSVVEREATSDVGGELPSISAPEGSAREVEGPSGGEDAAGARAVAPEGSARLIATITLGAGGPPIAGVEVNPSKEALAPGQAPTAVTDASGRVEFELLPGSVLGEVELLGGVTHVGVLFGINEEVESGEVVELNLYVFPGVSVSGVAVDEEGRPVPGVRVMCWISSYEFPWERIDPSRETITDSLGRFTLRNVWDRFYVTADGDGWTSLRGLRGFLDTPGDREGCDLVLTRPRAFSGRVIDDTGAAIQGVVAGCDQTYFDHGDSDIGVEGVDRCDGLRVRAESDVRGQFELAPLSVDSFRVSISCDGFLPLRQEVDVKEGPFEFRMARGATVGGRVLTSEGLPASGATVIIHPGVTRGVRLLTDEEGRFEAENLQLSEGGIVFVHHAGSAIHSQEGLELLGGRKTYVEITLSPGKVVEGRVVNAEGAGVPDARIQLTGDREVHYPKSRSKTRTWEQVLGLSQTRSDESGWFRVEDLYPGLFRLKVSPGELPTVRGSEAPYVEREVSSGDAPVTIILDSRGLLRVVLEGTIHSSVTSKPIERFDLFVWRPKGGSVTANLLKVDAPGGRFRLEGLEEGSIQFQFRAPGFASWKAPREDYRSGVHSMRVTLSEERAVSLRFLRAAGRVPAGLRVTVHYVDGEALHLSQGPFAKNKAVAAEGLATLSGLPAELLELRVLDPESEAEWVFPLDLRQEPAEAVELWLEEN